MHIPDGYLGPITTDNIRKPLDSNYSNLDLCLKKDQGDGGITAKAANCFIVRLHFR